MTDKRIAVAGLLLMLVAGAQAEPRGWMGVYHWELTRPMQIALGIDHGVLLNDVLSGSPADKAGLKIGDVILGIDEEDILSTADLSNYIGSRPEQTVKVVYLRQGKRDAVTLQLGTRDRQLEFSASLPEDQALQVPEATPAPRTFVKSTMEQYTAEVRSLREEIGQLRNEIERLRKDLKKLEKK